MNTLIKSLCLVTAFVSLAAAEPAHSAAPDTCAAWESAGRGWVCLADPDLWVYELPSCRVWVEKDLGLTRLRVCDVPELGGAQ